METITLVFSILLTVGFLAVAILQISSMTRKNNLFRDGGKAKIIYLITCLITIALFVAHLVTAKDTYTTKTVATGVVAIVALVASILFYNFDQKIGPKSKYAFMITAIVGWIAIIAHIVLALV